MPYCAVQLEELPRLAAEWVISARKILVAKAERISDPTALPHRVFIESPMPQEPTGSSIRAAYIDMRPSKLYPQLHIGTMCRISNIYPDKGCRFSVEARAFADREQLGGEAIAGSYDEARSLAFSWLDYSGNWLGHRWFEESPSPGTVVLPYEAPRIVRTSILLPTDQQAVSAVEEREQLRKRISAMNALSDSDLNLFLAHIASEILVGEVGTEVSRVNEPASGEPDSRQESSLNAHDWELLWKRLSRELRGLCRVRGYNFTCVATDHNILLRCSEPLCESMARITPDGISVCCGEKLVTFRVVKSAKRSPRFDGPERICSIPAFANWLLGFLVKESACN